MTCLLIDPVYRYHRVNEKICTALRQLYTTGKFIFIDLVVVPLRVGWRWVRWIVLFEWLPG